MVRQINVLILVTLFVFQISYIQYVTGNLVNTSRAAVVSNPMNNLKAVLNIQYQLSPSRII